MPFKLDPSLTCTKANVFCFRMVRTHPLTITDSSVGSTASMVFTLLRMEDAADEVVVEKSRVVGNAGIIPGRDDWSCFGVQ